MTTVGNGNIIFGIENLVDSATITPENEEPTMPATNVQDQIISVKFRSTSNDTYIDIDLGSELEFSLFGIFDFTASRVGTYRWLVTSGAGATGDTIYDSETNNPGGLQLWERAVSSLSRRWESRHFWFGQISDAEAETYPQHSIHIADEVIFGRYVRLFIDDSQSSDNFIEIGRLYVGPKEQLPYNFVFGSSEGADDGSARSTTLSGATIKDRRAVRRTASYRIDEVPEGPQQNWRSLFKRIQNEIATTKQIVVVPRPGDVIESTFNAIIASQSQINDLTYRLPGVSNTRIDIMEER